MNTQEHEAPIINECLSATHDLLKKYWGDIARTRDESDKLVAVTMSYKIDCTGQAPVVKTKIGFSRRFKAVRETTVDVEQSIFPFLADGF